MRLRSRFTLLFAVLSVAVALFLIAVFDTTLRRAVEGRVEERIEREAEHLAADRQRFSGSEEALDRFLRESARELGCRITLVAPDGVVTHDTDLRREDVAGLDNHGARPEIVEARRSGSGRSARFSATEREERIYFALRLPDAGFLRFSVSSARVGQIESAYLWSARAAVIVACAFLFLAGRAASRRFSRPIGELTEAASTIAAGELERDLPRGGVEEVRSLSAALQRMKDSLARAAERAESERRLAAAVFEKLPDGLVVVDSKLHILESNERFGRMVGFAAPAGRALYDLLRHRDLYSLFESTLKTGTASEATVRLADEMVWQVAVVPLPEGSRAAAVGVLRDITVLERTEGMRRTFVADVSHELRTPIASIAAAGETLAEGGMDDGDSRELVLLIRRQSERMRELIEDLMDLAQIESGAVELERETIALLPLLREVAADLAAEAKKRGVSVAVGGEAGASASGDRRRVGQIARNLLDNAIKFSPEGEKVSVNAFREGAWTGFAVEDRGPGVSRAAREKIFQRFYQIDRSRSKSRPGSGLGLAIVKHLVLLHGGTVEVESEIGRGSVFRVRLPAA